LYVSTIEILALVQANYWRSIVLSCRALSSNIWIFRIPSTVSALLALLFLRIFGLICSPICIFTFLRGGFHLTFSSVRANTIEKTLPGPSSTPHFHSKSEASIEPESPLESPSTCTLVITTSSVNAQELQTCFTHDSHTSVHVFNHSATSSISVDTEDVTTRELLAIPIVSVLCLSGFVLCFVGTAFDAIFVLLCYTPVDAGGLSFDVSILPSQLSKQ
jgi:hypothetical protein